MNSGAIQCWSFDLFSIPTRWCLSTFLPICLYILLSLYKRTNIELISLLFFSFLSQQQLFILLTCSLLQWIISYPILFDHIPHQSGAEQSRANKSTRAAASTASTATATATAADRQAGRQAGRQACRCWLFLCFLVVISFPSFVSLYLFYLVCPCLLLPHRLVLV